MNKQAFLSGYGEKSLLDDPRFKAYGDVDVDSISENGEDLEGEDLNFVDQAGQMSTIENQMRDEYGDEYAGAELEDSIAESASDYTGHRNPLAYLRDKFKGRKILDDYSKEYGRENDMMATLLRGMNKGEHLTDEGLSEETYTDEMNSRLDRRSRLAALVRAKHMGLVDRYGDPTEAAKGRENIYHTERGIDMPKEAAFKSETLGHMLNPLGPIGTLGGMITSGFTDTASKEDIEGYDDNKWSNILVPGLAGYRTAQRAGYGKNSPEIKGLKADYEGEADEGKKEALRKILMRRDMEISGMGPDIRSQYEELAAKDPAELSPREMVSLQHLSSFVDKEAYGGSPIEIAGTATGGLIGVYLGHLLKKSRQEALTQGQKLHWSDKATPYFTGAVGAKIGNRIGGGLKEMQSDWQSDRKNPDV